MLEKITVLAAALAEGSTDWDVRAFAHSVAEAQLDLEQVREARVLEHEAAGPGFSSKERSPAGWILRLSRLERYERRAFSRRERAIRRLEAAKAGPRPSSALVERGRQVIAEFWQNEATGAVCHSSGENWQNEASQAGCHSSGENPKKLEAAIPLRGRTSASVVSPTTGGTQSASVRQNEPVEAYAETLPNEANGALGANRRNEANQASNQNRAGRTQPGRRRRSAKRTHRGECPGGSAASGPA
jgi:hypothetical protein